jgi:hypothetical protein
MQPEADPRFRTAVAVIPDSSLFLLWARAIPNSTQHNGGKGDVGHAWDQMRPLLPLDICYLCLCCCHDSMVDCVSGSATGVVSEWFTRGGYARRVSVDTDTGCPLTWRVSISRAAIE